MRSFWDRFWDLPGLSWVYDDCLTACIFYLLIVTLAVVIWVNFVWKG